MSAGSHSLQEPAAAAAAAAAAANETSPADELLPYPSARDSYPAVRPSACKQLTADGQQMPADYTSR
jgi:hypothetical protein